MGSTVRLAVVGAGIGGLTLAVALRQRGLEPIVHEAADEIRPVGAGIWVPSNALRALDRLGLADTVVEAGVPLERARLVSVTSGLLQEISFAEVRRRFGHGNVSIHRAELHRVLLDALPGDSVRLGRRLASVEEDGESLRLDFEDGSSERADVVVGADGASSVVRRHVDPTARPRDAGQSCYRGVAAFELPSGLRAAGCEIWGGEARFGFSSLGDRRVYWFAPWSARDSEAPERPRELLDRLYAGFPEPVVELLAATPEEALVFTRLGDLAPMRRWSRGRAVLLGDAAHATTPNLGQGGAQAIEDAVALAHELAGCSAPADLRALSRAFSAFESHRREAAHRVVQRSRLFGKVAHWRQPIAVAVRDRLLRSMSEKTAIDQLAWLNADGPARTDRRAARGDRIPGS